MKRLNKKRRWIATQPAVARNDGQKRIKGFTLVELVITIAIVIILSVVSVPIYRSYTKQAKAAEGYALLGAILSSQKAYFSQYGMFLHSAHSNAGPTCYTSNDEILGIDARGNKYFTIFDIGQASDGVAGLKYNFIAYAKCPDDVMPNGKKSIRLKYNVTEGAEYDK